MGFHEPTTLENELRDALETIEALKSVCTPEQIQQADYIILQAFMRLCQEESKAYPDHFSKYGPSRPAPKGLIPR